MFGSFGSKLILALNLDLTKSNKRLKVILKDSCIELTNLYQVLYLTYFLNKNFQI